MKIKRNVNGQEIEFELTSEEMFEAFWEQEREYYKEDIQSIAEENDLTLTDVQLMIALVLYEKYIGSDNSWRYAAEEAIYVARQNN